MDQHNGVILMKILLWYSYGGAVMHGGAVPMCLTSKPSKLKIFLLKR